ncbi:TPA-induced transmembrane protein isoform X2 [Sagmatias obliquidens]|uniref:TPA-induced transmembrane protein isoform X2 n=1 Tax=Sagmatias obliquidens TaxID=3371155 RepID=UPI000F445AA9|nr:TPA-induced transmembrane protein isoform X2 [Lagenorhynchus obliquidens]
MSIHATARRPIRPSAQLLLCICTNSKRQSKQRPEQTRKTALFRCVPELTADQGCGTWRELGALPGRQSPPPTPHAPPGPAHRPRAPRPAPPTGGVGQATLEATLHPRVYASCFLAGCLILLSPFMEGAGPPSPGDDLELSVIQGQPDEQTPLSGAVQGIFPLEEEPCPVQADKESPWNSCNKNLVGKCKLWMVLASVFLGLVIVIIISLCLIGAHRCVQFITSSEPLLYFS